MMGAMEQPATNDRRKSDHDLLADFALHSSQPAFARLVERHVNMVYAAARRQVGGDAHLAEDVTQAVFLLLAEKSRAGRIGSGVIVAGWLYTATRYTAANARRAEAHRNRHERKAALTSQSQAAATDREDLRVSWAQLAPHLDAALARLPSTDRDALLLKYLQDKTHQEVGASLGLSEEAARKRVSRALDRLRQLLHRRGVALPATATLATLLTTHAAEAAPASVTLAAACGFAPTAAMTATSLAQSTLATLTWLKLKTAAIFLVTASILTTTALLSLQKITARRAPTPAAPLTLVLAPTTKTATYTGKVLTPAGQPAPAARVILAFPSDDGRPGGDAVTHTTRTGDDGAFIFRDIPSPAGARSPVLFATAQGHALAQAAAFSDEDNDLTLTPATTLRVTVLDPAGKPLPNLRLTPVAVTPRGPGLTFVAWLIPEIARELAQQTDANGVATFDAVPARASLRLDVHDPRFARLTFEDALDTADRPTTATLRLRPGGSISGVVTFGPTGKPAAGIQVGAQALDRNIRTAGGGHAVTNERGEYRMEQVSAGDYNVMLSSNGPDFRRDWAAAAREGVHLDPGQHLAGQDLTLVKGILVTGHVTRADSGKPVADQGIGCYSPVHPRSSAMIDSVRTDADGAFVFRTLPGPHKIYLYDAPPDGYERPKERDLTIPADQPPTVDFALVRKPGKPVAGRVLDVDGKPLPGVNVFAEDPKGGLYGAAHTVTDERGDFYFEAVTPGTLLRATRGRRETPTAIPVDGGEPEVVLRLAKRLRITLTGTVTDADGNPIANAKVQAIHQEGQFGTGMKPELTDVHGRYRIAGLNPSARYSLQAESPGFGTAGTRLTLDPAKPTAEAPPLRFEAVSRPISGTVVDNDNKPLPNVAVELAPTDPNATPLSTTTDAQGRFAFHVLAGTRAQLFTRDPAGKPFRPTDARAGDANLLLKTHP